MKFWSRSNMEIFYLVFICLRFLLLRSMGIHRSWYAYRAYKQTVSRPKPYTSTTPWHINSLRAAGSNLALEWRPLSTTVLPNPNLYRSFLREKKGQENIVLPSLEFRIQEFHEQWSWFLFNASFSYVYNTQLLFGLPITITDYCGTGRGLSN
jgi:hypothetical protein